MDSGKYVRPVHCTHVMSEGKIDRGLRYRQVARRAHPRKFARLQAAVPDAGDRRCGSRRNETCGLYGDCAVMRRGKVSDGSHVHSNTGRSDVTRRNGFDRLSGQLRKIPPLERQVNQQRHLTKATYECKMTGTSVSIAALTK